MLTKNEMQEIQDLKLRGYTKSEIPQYYIAQGRKPPSPPTIRKYYDMDVLTDKPGIDLQKDKVFDYEPFRPVIIEVLRNNACPIFHVARLSNYRGNNLRFFI